MSGQFNIVTIIQARMGSSRLPKKCMLSLNNIPIIEHIYNRCKFSKYINKIIVATTINVEDNIIENFCNMKNIMCYRGHETDLIDRYYRLAKLVNAHIIIRITSDCPYIDPIMMDNMILEFINTKVDYLYNTDDTKNKVYPEGSDIEIFNNNILDYIMKHEKNREHASGCIRLNSYYKDIFKVMMYNNNLDKLSLQHNFNGIHLSIDKEYQYELAKWIYNHFGNDPVEYKDILVFLDNNYEKYVNIISQKLITNKGQELYKKAKTMIPGGTQLLSKRPEMFLPNLWPSYYTRIDGIVVTDLDGNKYIDMGINGVGSCILGGNDKDVNNAVIECINSGNMSTLNHPNEVLLTEKLLELHPWAQMARYTRTSGEACTVAVRISRAYTKKDNIAFCGYHGWHDWYLATNINSNNNDGLSKHLLSGLSTNGVPKTLEGTIYPFTYNKINELEFLLETKNIGTIIMEPMRNVYPETYNDGYNFLQKVRKLSNKYNCILIFDEVTSGFRITNGGIHKMFNVEPDIAIFGKAMSNGYPLGTIIGKNDVMQTAQTTFISSTYWTEGIGFTAGLATINKFIEKNVANHINSLGVYFQTNLKLIANKHNIKLNVTGMPSITTFSFNYNNPLEIKTLYIQYMLEHGYLTTLALYLTLTHTQEIIDKYLEQIEQFFITYKKDIEEGIITKYLKGPIVHSGFQRLN